MEKSDLKLVQQAKEIVLTSEEGLENIRRAYEEIIEILREYCDLREEYYSVIALWIIGTYFHGNFNTYPYLFLNAMRGSGKTRLLKLLASLCNNAEIQANISEAVLFRTAKGGTILLDEFESIGSKEKGILRELLNAGYKKGIKVKRMRKVTKQGEEDHIVQEFDLFVPIAMANIWGIEEVLADRCITLTLEKSGKRQITRMIEDFEECRFSDIKRTLMSGSVVCVDVVTKKTLIKAWNNYLRERYNITTLNNTNTLTTQDDITTLEEERMFNKIYDSNLDGRHLEIFFPLLIIARTMSEEHFDNFLTIAQNIVNEKKEEENIESKDVLIYNFVGSQIPVNWYTDPIAISEITNKFKDYVGSPEEEMDWLNTKWIGRALKRLNLVKKKLRKSNGRFVLLDVEKARMKMTIFKDNYNGEERRIQSIPVEVDRRKS